MRTRFLLPALAFCFLAASHAYGAQAAWSWCSQGAQPVIVGGVSSSQFFNQSYPQCTVTVYLHGTTTLATVYADNSGTALSNPFTASRNGYFTFYALNGRYDATLSGAGIPSPYTLSDILLNDPFAPTGVAALCSGTSTDTTGFAAVAALTTQTMITIPTGATCSIGSMTIPANVTLNIQGGGRLNALSGATVVIGGPLVAPLNQVFGGPGTIVFSPPGQTSSGATRSLQRQTATYPEWWGATGNGITDDTVPVQSAMNSVCQSSGQIFFTGNYSISQQLFYPWCANIGIFGAGMGSSTIKARANSYLLGLFVFANISAGWPLTGPSTGGVNRVSIATGGGSYHIGDLVTVVQTGGSGGTVEVTNVSSSGAVTGIEPALPGLGYSIATVVATSGGSGGGLVINIDSLQNQLTVQDLTVDGNVTNFGVSAGILAWSSSQPYYATGAGGGTGGGPDGVYYNGAAWVATATSTNQAPAIGSSFWRQVQSGVTSGIVPWSSFFWINNASSHFSRVEIMHGGNYGVYAGPNSQDFTYEDGSAHDFCSPIAGNNITCTPLIVVPTGSYNTVIKNNRFENIYAGYGPGYTAATFTDGQHVTIEGNWCINALNREGGSLTSYGPYGNTIAAEVSATGNHIYRTLNLFPTWPDWSIALEFEAANVTATGNVISGFQGGISMANWNAFATGTATLNDNVIIGIGSGGGGQNVIWSGIYLNTSGTIGANNVIMAGNTIQNFYDGIWITQVTQNAVIGLNNYSQISHMNIQDDSGTAIYAKTSPLALVSLATPSSIGPISTAYTYFAKNFVLGPNALVRLGTVYHCHGTGTMTNSGAAANIGPIITLDGINAVSGSATNYFVVPAASSAITFEFDFYVKVTSYSTSGTMGFTGHATFTDPTAGAASKTLVISNTPTGPFPTAAFTNSDVIQFGLYAIGAPSSVVATLTDVNWYVMDPLSTY